MKATKTELLKLVEEIVNKRLNEAAKQPEDMSAKHKELKTIYREFSRAAKEYIKAVKSNGFASEGDHLASLLNSGVGGFMNQVKKIPIKNK